MKNNKIAGTFNLSVISAQSCTTKVVLEPPSVNIFFSTNNTARSMLAAEIEKKGIDNIKDLPSLKRTNYLIQNAKRKLGKISQTNDNGLYAIDDSVKNLNGELWLQVQTSDILLFASARYVKKITVRIKYQRFLLCTITDLKILMIFINTR
jgi:hypothetical protein